MLKNIITKKIGVIGYGLEGQDLVNFLIKNGASDISVFDESKINEVVKHKKVSFYIGKLEDNNYDGIELFYRSPGVKRERLESILPEGVEISSPTNLFFNISKGKKIIVTGTKGKSTTSNIIYQVLKDNKIDAHLGGNVGNPLLGFVDKLKSKSYTVVELSSFQLQDFTGSADACVFLPIKEDHLDYHKDFDEYFLAKKQAIRSVKKGGIAVLPSDHLSKKLLGRASVEKFYYSTDKKVKSGCYIDDGNCICVDGRAKSVIGGIEALSTQYKIPIVNILASIALSYKLELRIRMRNVLRGFNKPKYRIETIDTSVGLTFLNDSASTNPISTIEAIKLMTEPFVLVMGGSSKKLDYSDLAKLISRNNFIKRILLFGQTSIEIKRALDDIECTKTVLIKNNLAEVFEDIVSNHKNYQSVLFSPASASFDQFKNYQERGETFNNLVQESFE